MAGIKANSATQTMGDGDTAADQSVSGYVVGEKITLSTTGSPSSYSWGQATPSGSTSRADLSSFTSATPVFTPDVAGYYVITVTVDGSTAYVLRISVIDTAPVDVAQAHRYPPVADGSVPTPALGETHFYSSTGSRMKKKTAAGTVKETAPEERTGTFTLSSGTVSVADTSVTAATVVAMHCETASSRGTLVITPNAGVGFDVQSSDGSDASTWRYALIG